MFDQPDLFAATPEELRREISRYGGGTPPLWIAPAPEVVADDEPEDFSPERAADAAERRQQRRTVSIRVISMDRLAELAQ